MAWFGLSCLFLPLLLAVCLYAMRRRWLAAFVRLPKAQYAIAVERRLPVPLSDGASLLADHYYPKAPGSFPTILIRSPWGRGWEKAPLSLPYLFVAGRFAERGYHVIVHSTREQPDERLAFYPAHEGDDGLAVLRWIEQQPWCNGAVGWWGASYLGYIQWATAVQAPVPLKAIVPISTAANWSTFFYHDGALALERLLNIADTTRLSKLSSTAVFGQLRSQAQRVHAAAMHLPLSEADVVLQGTENPGYREVLAHPPDDPGSPDNGEYWCKLNLATRLGQVTAAAHFVAGWHDIFLRQQLADYTALIAAGRNPYLTIGPWRHTDSDLSGAGIREGLAWFDAHLAGRPQSLRPLPVRIFVIEADTWLDLPTWPPPAQTTAYSLADGRQLQSAPSPQNGQDTFCYDPADPTPALGGAQLGAGAHTVDNAPLEARSDVLAYTSAPLTAGMTVIGAPEAVLYVRADAARADFFVRLCAVDEKGRSTNVCDGFVRIEDFAAHQDEAPRLLQIALEPTARQFHPGDRLRLLIAGGAHPRWNRNLSAGGFDIDSTALAVTEQTVYYGPAHPSVLHLPVVEHLMIDNKEQPHGA